MTIALSSARRSRWLRRRRDPGQHEITKFKHDYEDKLNVSVYLCPLQQTQRRRQAEHHVPGTRPTPAQTAHDQAMLDADPMVSRVDLRLGAAGATRSARIDAGRGVGRRAWHVGDLPASFTVKLNNIKKRLQRRSPPSTTAVAGVDQVNERDRHHQRAARRSSTAPACSRSSSPLVVLVAVDPADRQHHPGGGRPATQRDQHHASGRRLAVDDRAAVHARGDHRQPRSAA